MAWGVSTTAVQMALNLVQGIVLVPLYLHYLDTSVYGGWLAASGVFAVLSLVDPGLGEVMRLRVAAALGRDDRPAAAVTIGTSIALLAGSVVALLLLGVTAATIIPVIVHIPGNERPAMTQALVVGVTGTGLLLAAYACTAILEAMQRQFAAGIAQIAAATVSITVSAFLLVYTRLGLMALALAPAIRAAVTLGISLPQVVTALRHDAVPRPRWAGDEARDLLHTVATVVLSRVASTVATQAAPILIANALGPAETVTFVMTARARDVLSSFPSRISHAAAPVLAHAVGTAATVDVSEEPRTRVARKALAVTALAIAVSGGMMACYLALNGAFVVRWIGAVHYGGMGLTFALALGGLMVSARDSLAYGIGAFGDLRFPARLIAVEVTLRLLLAVAFLHLLGSMGPPIAEVVAVALVAPPMTIRLRVLSRLRASEVRGTLARTATGCVVAFAVAILAARVASPGLSWLHLAWYGAIVATIVALLVLAIDVGARTSLVNASASLCASCRARRQPPTPPLPRPRTALQEHL